MAIAKGWDVGDTVYVRYPQTTTEYWTPQTRVVASCDIISATDNKALVKFTSGNNVEDDDTTVRIYTTEALCAAGIVTDVISNVAASVVLDATTSIVSTAGNSSTTLGRIG